MRLEELLLRKEELPVFVENRFQVPIFPLLLSKEVVFEKEIASRVFHSAALAWQDDLREYAQSLEEKKDKDKREWLEETYLDKPVTVIVNDLGRQIVDPPGFWEDLVITGDNGLVTGFSISRNAGGSLYLGDNFEREQVVIHKLVRFTPVKLAAYLVSGDLRKVYCYSMHNVDFYQGALFLRNWAILYLNEALKE